MYSASVRRGVGGKCAPRVRERLRTRAPRARDCVRGARLPTAQHAGERGGVRSPLTTTHRTCASYLVTCYCTSGQIFRLTHYYILHYITPHICPVTAVHLHAIYASHYVVRKIFELVCSVCTGLDMRLAMMMIFRPELVAGIMRVLEACVRCFAPCYFQVRLFVHSLRVNHSLGTCLC